MLWIIHMTFIICRDYKYHSQTKQNAVRVSRQNAATATIYMSSKISLKKCNVFVLYKNILLYLEVIYAFVCDKLNTIECNQMIKYAAWSLACMSGRNLYQTVNTVHSAISECHREIETLVTRVNKYCRSGNIREVLIFANFARRTNSRI